MRAVKTSTEAFFQEIRKDAYPTSTTSTVQSNKFEIDRLEQFSRMDNVKVVENPASEDENCMEKVKKLGRAIGVEIP